MVEIGPQFLAAIGGTIALMMLFLMVVVLWDIALALRDVAEKIDYLEDDVDSDLATINGTLTRIYDRMGSGSAASSVDAGAQAGAPGVGAARNGAGGADVGQAGAGVGSAAPERTQSPGAGAAVEPGAVQGQAGDATGGGVGSGAGAANGGRQRVANPRTAGVDAEAGAGSAEPEAAGIGGPSANAEAADSEAVDSTAGGSDAGDAGDAGGTNDSVESAEPAVDPAAVAPITDHPDDPVSEEVDAEADAGGDADAEAEETLSAGEPSAESGGDEPTPDANGGNVGRFASDGKGGTAWYEVEFDLPPGARTGSSASSDAPIAGRTSSASDDVRERSGEGPFGLQRPGLRSQLEQVEDEPFGPTPSDADGVDDAHDPVEAFGGEDIAETTVTDVATVSLAELHRDDDDGSDAAGESDASEGLDAAEEPGASGGPDQFDGSGEIGDVPAIDDADVDAADADAVDVADALDDVDAVDVADDAAEAGEDASRTDGDETEADADAIDEPDAPSAVEDVLGAADAEPPGTDVDELADALESRRADASAEASGEGVAADDDLADAADAVDAAEEDGGDIAELVNRELDTLTQEVGGTSMTPDVSEEALDDAVDELDDGEYTFPLSGSAFQVGASTDAETVTLRFTPENPVELDGARERLLKYQLRNYLDRDDTAHAELSVDGGTVILDIPGADGPAVDAWADAAVQIVDRTLYLSKDDE